MNNETRLHIQKLQEKISWLVDTTNRLKAITTTNERDIAELKKENRALKTEIQILKDGGNI